mgnify:CR=1 FL=1
MPVNGSSFLLLKDDTVIGHSKSVSFNVNADLPDSSTKDSYGWKEFIVGLRSGSINCECITDYSEALQYEDLVDMIITKTKAVFVIKELTNPRIIVRGEGFIQSVDETAEFNSATSFNVEIKLTGIFTITDPTEGLTWENVFKEWQNISDNWEDV